MLVDEYVVFGADVSAELKIVAQMACCESMVDIAYSSEPMASSSICIFIMTH
ncbi:MAG: hypothetical protein MJK11_01995 [Pseudomonadales bacterium]|nr:hypothetical protein [Pseudomonadales bacterium]